MTDLLDLCREHLLPAGYTLDELPGPPPGLAFESDTVLGFLVAYQTVQELLGNWRQDLEGLFASRRFGLRHAGDKAWNAYAVLISREGATDGEVAGLSSIEEDLVGYRKITHAGVSSSADARDALLPLLPLQSAPKLEAVDMAEEIKIRTTELPSRVIEGFLASADESVMLQVLEEGP